MQTKHKKKKNQLKQSAETSSVQLNAYGNDKAKERHPNTEVS